MKYKIIKEYERFYLCEYDTPKGKIRECFIKDNRINVENGYVIVKNVIPQIHLGLSSDKVNRSFNPFRGLVR